MRFEEGAPLMTKIATKGEVGVDLRRTNPGSEAENE